MFACVSVDLSATSVIEELCCCIDVVTVLVVYDIRTFCCHIFTSSCNSTSTSHNVSL